MVTDVSVPEKSNSQLWVAFEGHLQYNKKLNNDMSFFTNEITNLGWAALREDIWKWHFLWQISAVIACYWSVVTILFVDKLYLAQFLLSPSSSPLARQSIW